MTEYKAAYNMLAMRLSHVPTVTTCGKQFAVWSDIKQMLLWCADPHCSVLLDALNHARIPAFIHPCSKQEQIEFATQFVAVRPGTCLVDLEILTDPQVLSYLHNEVRKNHMESGYNNVCRCSRMLRVIMMKYANTSFKIPLRMASNMNLLPALKRNILIYNHDGSRDTNSSDPNFTMSNTSQTSIECINSLTLTLVPVSILAIMYPECIQVLTEATRQHIENISMLYQCTVEEGILLTRFVSSYRGYDSHWSCFTSNSLLISWTEFWNRLDSYTQNKLYNKLSNTGMIILNCQAVAGSTVQNTYYKTNQTAHPAMVTGDLSQQEQYGINLDNEISTPDPGIVYRPPLLQSADVQQRGKNNIDEQNEDNNPELDQGVQHMENNTWEQKSTVNATEAKLENQVIDNETMPNQVFRNDNHTCEPVYNFKNGDYDKSVESENYVRDINNSTKNVCNKELDDKMTKDMNNSATKKKDIGLIQSKPGSGDTGNIEKEGVGFKPSFSGNEVLSVNKLTLSKMLNPNTGLVQGSDSNGFNDKQKHIFVPVCDNETKGEFSVTEVSGYDLTSLATEELGQGIQVSITPRRGDNKDQCKPMGLTSDSHATKRDKDVERKYLKLPTAYIQDDMPEAIRLDSKAVNFSAKYAPTNDSLPRYKVQDSGIVSSVADTNTDCPQPCDGYNDKDKPRYSNVTYLQLELTTPMLKGIDLDPNVIQESRKFPYKPVRNDQKQQSKGSPITLPPSTLTTDPKSNHAVPVIEGTQINVKSATETPPMPERTFFCPQNSIIPPLRDPIIRKSANNSEFEGLQGKQPKVVHMADVFDVSTSKKDNECKTSETFVATGKVIKKFERNTDFNSSEFMKERITMWRDSVEQALHPNKTERLTKSAGVRRSRPICSNRPMSSVNFSPGSKFERENQVISPSMCPTFARGRSLQQQLGKQQSDSEDSFYEPVQQRNNSVEVQNYGSSSSSTPDIYDEYARKRRPKLIKPETIQIKPKPVTKPIPTTLCQPIVRKTPPQPVAPPKPVSQNHHTAGYTYQTASRSKAQTTIVMKVEDIKPINIKQTYQHSSTTMNNLYHNSKAFDLKHMTSAVPSNVNSNTSCSYPACSLNKNIARKIPSAKDGRKAYVPEFCMFERPPTAKSSSTVESNSSIYQNNGLHDSMSKSNHIDKTEKMSDLYLVRKGTDNERENIDDVTSTLSGSLENRKSQLLENVASFANTYISPRPSESLEDINSIHAILSTNPLQSMEEIGKGVNSGKIRPASNGQNHKENIPESANYKSLVHEEDDNNDQVLSKVDSQLYYKVPEDDTYHRVTGNMIIPPDAQFFMHSRETSEKSLSAVNSFDTLAAESNTEYFNNPSGNEIIDSYDGSNISSSKKTDGIGEVAMEENDNESIFDKILMTSTEFKDKVEQMKHIILETEQAIRKANEQDNDDDDEEEANSVSKENSNISVMSKKLQDAEKDLHKNNKLDPPKVISPSPRLEMPKKIVSRKKSFKEVVEEKRALKKKTEKELSKKKFWTSAHIVEKNEQASNKIDKDKTKPSEKGKKTSGNNTVCSGKSKIQQDIPSSKSACNEVNGKKKDDNQITAKKKGSTVSQRPKTSEMKAAIGPKPKTSEPKSTAGPRPKTSEQKPSYKERPLRGSTSLTNSDQSKIKLSTNSISAQNYPIKTTANCNVRKQRASKSARQFPRSYGQSGQKNESTDECTNKILTALRRMSIEKPTKETQIKESPKLDARQRKLRHCVVKGISGEKSVLVNKPDIEKEKPVKTVEIDSNLINQENVEETLDTSTSQIIHTHAEKQALLDNTTNDCFVSLVRINENTFAQKKHSPNAALSYQKEENSLIGKSNSSSSTLQVDQNIEEEISKNTEEQIDQNIEETTSGHELDERTFITKFNVSELNRHNGYENNNFVSNEIVGSSDSEWMNDEVPESGDLIDANVNCPVNETGIMTASSSTHTKPVQIYLNASEEQYALPDNGCMYSYIPADKGFEASQVKVEMPDAADVIKHEQVDCWGTNYTSEQYVNNNDNERIDHGTHYYDKTEEQNMLYYATDYPDHSEYHRHYGWIPKQECDNDMYASHGHYTCLDNEYYHNEGMDARLLSKNLENVNTGWSNSENEVTNGELNQKYSGLRLAWNDSEIVRDGTLVHQNGCTKEEFINETKCGKEIYIDIDEPCVKTMSHSENTTTDEIVHNDVFLNTHDEPTVGIVHTQDMLKEDECFEVAKCTTAGDTDQIEMEKSECNKDVLNSRRDILWSEFDKDKRPPSVSSSQYTGGTSIYSGNLSPSQSEMNVYFEKVSERAGLNPFLENCLDDVSEMSTNMSSEQSDHQVVAKDDKSFFENRTSKNCTKADIKGDSEFSKGNQFLDKNVEDSYDIIQHKKDAQQLPNVNVEDEIDVSQHKNVCYQPPNDNVKDIVGGRSDEDNVSVATSSTDDGLDDYDDDKSDDADKDYDPGVDSCSDSDDDNDSVVDGQNEGMKCKTVKSVNKMKKRNKKKDQEKNSGNKEKGNDFVNESWTKFLKDTYASDNKDENVKKILKKKRKQKDDKQTKLESSIVRDYCLKHVDSEESLAQLKSKLLKQKYLANELKSKVDKKHKDQVKKSKSETCNKKASKLNKKSKSRKSKLSAEDDANDSDEERRKEKEEIKAAEGFIKTQKLYFNILKKMSMDGCKPSKEIEEESTASSPKVEDLPEVLEAVAVHGERIITKTESEAEKALEGTGSLDKLTEDQGTIIEDLTNQCRYQMIEDEDHVQLGGIAFFKAFQLPFVYINGYKYTPVKDAVGMFQPICCPKKCAIPRNVITKYKTLVKSFSTWEQVYKLDLIKLKKGPTVKTGDMLVKLDSVLSLLPDIVNTIIQQHKDTKLKNSQSCLMNEYKNLLISFKE